MPSFQTVECATGDLVRVASVALEVVPGVFRVAKKGRNTVYLVGADSPGDPKPWHKTRVIEVINRSLGQMEEATASSYGIDLGHDPAPALGHLKDAEAILGPPEREEAHAPVKRKRGRPPKPKPPEALFSLGAYISTFGSGCETWTRSGRSTASNILIEPDHKSFWYFRTDPKTDRPKRKFYGSLPNRLGRHFPLCDYDIKVAVLKAKGYTKR